MEHKIFEVGYLNNSALFGSFVTEEEANKRQEEVVTLASENVFIQQLDNGEIVSWMNPQIADND